MHIADPAPQIAPALAMPPPMALALCIGFTSVARWRESFILESGIDGWQTVGHRTVPKGESS